MLKLFSDIKLTRGYNRSLMQDFTKGKIEFLYNDVYDILSECKNYEDLNVFKKQNEPLRKNIERLASLFIFNPETSKTHDFPEVQMERFFPYPFQAISIYLNKANAKHLCRNKPLYTHSTQNIYLIINGDTSLLRDVLEVYKNFQSIRFIVVCSSKQIHDLILTYEFLADKNIDIILSKPKIPSFELSNNTYLFFENQNYNSGWNEKIHINSNGDIGINVDDALCLGNINEITEVKQLVLVLDHPEYIKYSTSSNENTYVCKDCEFRFMCTDIQKPYLTLKNRLFYKKIECEYNPYIAKWKDEEGYLTLSECGVISDENGFSIDHKKIATINEQLWGEY